MKYFFLNFLVLVFSCKSSKQIIRVNQIEASPFSNIVKDSAFTKVKMDSLIKNDDINAHSLCDYVQNDNMAEMAYNPACILTPLKTFKFDWSKTNIALPIKNYSDCLVSDSNFLFYYTQFKDSIIGFSSAYMDIKTNKWKIRNSSQNDGNSESAGTIYNLVFSKCKSYSKDVFVIRYSERRFGFAFFSNKELNIITYLGAEITQHINFNEWASKLSKIAYK